MAYKTELDAAGRKEMWDIVRQIIRDNYSEIKEKSKSLRDSFYIVRDHLSKEFLNTGKITQQQYSFYETENDAYGYFTQDIWTQMEKEGFERPDAKPIGIFYWQSYKNTIDKIASFLPQCRGFVYVEKEGIADKLSKISNYGWGVIAAQGQATREIRKLIKSTGKPCVVVHDYDPDGETIFHAIENKSRRMQHLDFDLGENATELIIKDEQADFLIKEYDVPTQPLPKKHQGTWKKDYRIELSAFVVVDTPSGNSVLDFFICEMKRAGFKLSLKPIAKKHLFKEAIADALEWEIKDLIETILRDYKIEGDACKAELGASISVQKNPQLNEILKQIIKKQEKKVKWISEADMEEEILEEVPMQWINREESE